MVGPAVCANARIRSRASGRGNDFLLAGGDGRARQGDGVGDACGL